jgi:hypothetical protein
MRRCVGEARLEESGTLPWTIESNAHRLASALHKGERSTMFRGIHRTARVSVSYLQKPPYLLPT